MRNRASSTAGQTLLNALVVVAVLGVLAAIVPLAIVRAREGSRQTRCRANLAQCGLALQAYHDFHKVYPPGIVAISVPRLSIIDGCEFIATQATCDAPGSAMASGLAMILPYLGEQRIAMEYNFHVACCASANSTAVSRGISGLVCPSNLRVDRTRINTYYQTSGLPTAPGSTDYVFNLGAAAQLQCDNPFVMRCYISGLPGRTKPSVGAFGVNSSVNIDTVKDGTSNTFLMGESCGGDLPIGLNSGGSIVDGIEAMSAGGSSGVCDNPWSQGYIGGWPRGRTNSGGFGSVFAATAWNAWYDNTRRLPDPAKWSALPPNEGGLRYLRPTYRRQSVPTYKITAIDGSAIPASIGSMQGFRSRHPGMVLMLFADGSVRTISDSIDLKVWAAFSTVAGRELVDLLE